MYDDIDPRVLRDAGLLFGSTRAFSPLPVKVDGLKTVALCFRIDRIDTSGCVLHPALILPHPDMLIQDARSAPAKVIRPDMMTVHPNTEDERLAIEAVMRDPDQFFRNWRP